MLSFRVPSEHAEEGWCGGRSACQEVGGIVVEKLEWTPAVERSEPVGQRMEAEEKPPGPHPGFLHEPCDRTAPEPRFLLLPSQWRHQKATGHQLISYSFSLIRGNWWSQCPMLGARHKCS